MGKASRTKYDIDRRQKIAAQRAAARHAQTRNRLLIASGAIIAVVAVAISLVLVRPGSSTAVKTPPSDGPTGAALASTVRDLTTVPASVLDRVGGGSLTTADIGSATAVGGGYLTPVSGSPLTKDGKPEVLYVGADFCPYCAALRWPLIVALSRFGTFSGLTPARSGITTGSGQPEPYPATPTWTFHGSSYTSRYLAFSPVETSTSVPDPASGGYTALETPTPAQQQIMAKYDPAGGIPFVNIGNRYIQLSTLAPYGPEDLQGKTWAQITAALRDPSSALGRQINASANYITAAICKITGNQPATACTPAVTALQSRLG
jgi:thiol-disulfide isomerase/thioredoxin